MDKWFIVESIHGQVDVYTARDHFSALMKAIRRFDGVKNLKSQPRLASKEDLQITTHSATSEPKP